MSRLVPKSRLGKSAAAVALAVAIVGTFEGVRTVAYIPIPGDVPTICFGETRGVRMGDKHTLAECKKMLGDGLIEFSVQIDHCLAHENRIPDKTYVAFLSLAYNIGSGAFCKSSVVRLANAGELGKACDAILRFNRAGGRVVRGLENRRREERALCLQGLTG